ncbi:MAG: SoxR reducing system RseC family protein [Clostridia bacterium]|nr:SoxR reducing system RseC family protein [Clostridia bacterium]
MIETGTVIKAQDGNIAVQFKRKTDCEKCKMCMFSENSNIFEIEFENTVNASAGDIVSVEMPKRIVLFSSFIVYIIPLLFCAAGLFLGYFIWGEIAAIALSAAFIALGFVFIILLEKYLNKTKKLKKPVVTAIVKKKIES